MARSLIDVHKHLLDTINKYAEALSKIEKELPPEYWDYEIHGIEASRRFVNINHVIREALYNQGRTACLSTTEAIKELSAESH